LDFNYSYLIITLVFFLIGFLISHLLRLKYRSHHLTPSSSSSQIDNLEIIEAIENRKQLQIDTLMHKINNIQIKLDLFESILNQLSKGSYTDKNITQNQNIASQNILSSDVANKKLPNISHKDMITAKPVILNDRQNATNYYILRLLLKESLTSNEIKNAIGRTREHTARLMKKLYELKLVDRDITTKPFKYRLTEQGKKYLEKHIEKNELKLSNPSNDTLLDLTR
jgi:DNA-binding MarR family transcriptional regulator